MDFQDRFQTLFLEGSQHRFQTLFLEGSEQESGYCSDTWVAGGTLSTEREEQESDILTSQKLSLEKPLQFIAVQGIHLWLSERLALWYLGNEVQR